MTKVCTHGRGADVALQQLKTFAPPGRSPSTYVAGPRVHLRQRSRALFFAQGGVIEALTRAKQQGKTRFVGFTGHKDPAIPSQDARLWISPGYVPDATLTVLTRRSGVSSTQVPSGARQMRHRAHRDEKALPAPAIRSAKASSPEEALVLRDERPRNCHDRERVDSVEVLRQNVALATHFEPLHADAMQALRERMRPMASDGRHELGEDDDALRCGRRAERTRLSHRRGVASMSPPMPGASPRKNGSPGVGPRPRRASPRRRPVVRRGRAHRGGSRRRGTSSTTAGEYHNGKSEEWLGRALRTADAVTASSS